jgi:transposase
MSQRYPTDLTETEWTILAPFVPAAKPGGRPLSVNWLQVLGTAELAQIHQGVRHQFHANWLRVLDTAERS